MGLILPADDVVRIADRVREGDPTVGWQGDPTMDTYLDEATATATVFGFDRHGDRYIAAQVSVHDPGWRHELLRKLHAGDWRRPDTVDRQVKLVEDQMRARQAQTDELADEKAEKLAWAIRRDAGHLVGTSKEFY